MHLLNDLTVPNEHFYARLPINQIPLDEILLKDELFFTVPENWHVIVTDIKGSTEAVAAGLHQQINLIATGSTVASLNIAFNKGITIPFFFGGDGATFLVPASLKEELLKSLQLYRHNTMINTHLELRVGEVPVQQIYAAGFKLRLSKFGSSASFAIPVLLGDGLGYAEKLIKGTVYGQQHTAGEEKEPDLTGMLCRWDEIPAPKLSKEVVTLLVVSQSPAIQANAFSRVMKLIGDIYGPPAQRQPLSIAKLRLKSTFTKLGPEVRSRAGKSNWLESLHNRYIGVLGYIYFRTPTGVAYLKNLVEMSDTLLIDGRINTVISGTTSQRHALERALDAMEINDEVLYGLHSSTASVMSCYVRNPQDGHIYFVDGSQGGYTMAARMLKFKIKKDLKNRGTRH